MLILDNKAKVAIKNLLNKAIKHPHDTDVPIKVRRETTRTQQIIVGKYTVILTYENAGSNWYKHLSVSAADNQPDISDLELLCHEFGLLSIAHNEIHNVFGKSVYHFLSKVA